jgi:hypothetical protein
MLTGRLSQIVIHAPVRNKSSPATRHGSALGEKNTAPTHSWPRHWMGVSGQRHASAALCPGERSTVPIVQEAGWAPEPVWTQRLQEKSFAPAGDRTPIARSVVRHYTDWVTPALHYVVFTYSIPLETSGSHGGEYEDDITPCSLEEEDRRFRDGYCFHLQCNPRRLSSSLSCLFKAVSK